MTDEASAELTVLDSARVTELVPMPAAVTAVRAAFVALARGEFELPERIHLREGGFLVMPCHHRPSGTTTVKTISLNFDRVPAILGTVLWTEFGSTRRLVADAGAITALRTGAVSGVATDLLAPPGASRCALLGTGGQARAQVRAVHAVRPLTRLVVAGRDRGKAERFAATIGVELGIGDVTVAATPREAVRDAEIICCATTAREPLLSLADLPATAHVNAIGSYRPDMRELADDVLTSGLLVVDDKAAVLHESGEILHAIGSGALDTEAMIDLGTALTAGVTRPRRTIFKSVGVAVQDWAVAAVLAQRTRT